MRITLQKSLAAWQTPVFEAVFKQEMRELDMVLLPLQAALSHSSHVSETAIEPVVLHSSESVQAIQVKTGIFYGGITAGSCCADDPTPVCEQTEYCELVCTISKTTAEACFSLLTV